MQTILVSLDFSYMDEHLIRYTFSTAQKQHTEKVILVHAAKEGQLQTEMEFEGKMMPAHEALLEQMKATVAKVLGETEFSPAIVYELMAGEPLIKILEASKKHATDLIVVGKKKIGDGTGNMSKKLSRRALCSVLTLTEKPSADMKKILIPIDFSQMSKTALKKALHYTRNTGIELTCLNIIGLPTGYHTSGKRPEEYAKILISHAEKRFAQFIEDLDTEGAKLSCRFHFDPTNSKGAKIIFNIALVEDADLIVIGSRGKSEMAAKFLGSTTERLLLNNLSIPTLVVKDRDQKVNFFEALINI
ncbi:universal stress protein [Limibacter armeniacum]|uniref:universal stress protein n=1 Tax=Limibacter armeniacum TaxID=466084 RepID=UPI002FE524F9